MPKLRHIAIAAKDPDAMAEFYKEAFGFTEVSRRETPLAYGVHLSDGTLNLALLRFKTDQLGKGMDYTGVHHFGVLVEDVDAFSKKIESLGGTHYIDRPPESAKPAGEGPDAGSSAGYFEVKFYGPEGVLFDIAEHPWGGAAPLEEPIARAAE